MHDATIWQRVSVEELVKSQLGGTGEFNDLDWGRQVKWLGRGENQVWTMTHFFIVFISSPFHCASCAQYLNELKDDRLLRGRSFECTPV